ncbi:hypothetical protein BCR33DRAFT_845486, partial [Rhizoclosmatium globosum]
RHSRTRICKNNKSIRQKATPPQEIPETKNTEPKNQVAYDKVHSDNSLALEASQSTPQPRPHLATTLKTPNPNRQQHAHRLQRSSLIPFPQSRADKLAPTAYRWHSIPHHQIKKGSLSLDT